MKTMRFSASIILFSLVVTAPLFLFAQWFDKRQDRSLPHASFSKTAYTRQQPARATIPLITDLVGAISTDTLENTLRQLQNWGSRFMLNDNHKDVATWLMNKFISYGYTDVKLDSFYNTNPNFYTDSTWQYNVVCTLHGASAANEIYVVGGHYDSFSNTDPFTEAPGVDDNGSGTAATLETARVMAAMNFHPEATIRFVLFAAEELGLFGSKFDAHQAKLEGKDIRLMFNMDMVANDPDNLKELIGDWYPGFKWAWLAAAGAIERYTDLSVIIYDVPVNGADSYAYYEEGFPAFDCIENDFSPYYHSPADTVGNYNIPYLAKVTGGAIATLAEQQLFPTPQGVIAHSSDLNITLQWKSTDNSIIQGVNIYRSVVRGSQYQKINSTPISVPVYQDITVEPNRQYYYVLTTVNDSLQEGGFSEEVTGVRFNFCDTLLVLANLKGTLTTPDSVFAFYQAVLDTIPYVWYDLNASNKVSLGMLSRYHSVLWMNNSTSFESPDDTVLQAVSEFISQGGNILFTGFHPMKYWMNLPTYPVKIPETSFYRQLFKVDSAECVAQCMMYRANTSKPDYDTMNVDTQKNLSVNFPGQVYNLEILNPAPNADIIYRLDSKYDTTSNFGRMKNHPVGLEYMGADYKSILLSFPLYYIDTNDARAFLHYVMTKKFNSQTGIAVTDPTDLFALCVYPNPAHDICFVSFNLPENGQAKISLFSSQGQVLKSLYNNRIEKGTHLFSIETGGLSPGLYRVVLESEKKKSVRSIVIIR
jgi:hypothetical protein